MDPRSAGDKSRTDPGTGSPTIEPEPLDSRRELADFLRQRRAAIGPAEAGLPAAANGRRRTPGLRREELAALAGISVDWYIRLEQRRAERPSPSVLDALARALQMSADERAHLYALARAERPPLDHAPDETTDPGLERVLRSLPEEQPAYVLGRRWDVLAWNRGACELLIDFDGLPSARRNLVELTFLDERLRGRYADWDEVVRITVANFRASVARHLQLPEVQELIGHLTETDPTFAALWARHEVSEKTTGVKRFSDVSGEPVPMRFESLLSPSAQDQRLIVYSRVPSGEDQRVSETP
jgi:transcriptional regulator with XRE-family HTH domain